MKELTEKDLLKVSGGSSGGTCPNGLSKIRVQCASCSHKTQTGTTRSGVAIHRCNFGVAGEILTDGASVNPEDLIDPSLY